MYWTLLYGTVINCEKSGWKRVKAISLKAFRLRMFPWFWNSSLSWPRSNHRYLRKLGCVSRDISKIYNGIWMHGTECNPSSTFELWQQSKSEKLQSDIFYKKNQLAYDRTFCLTFQHVIWHSVWSALSNNLQLHLEAVCWNN